jgi:uncharacterized protein (TIGR03437 family)
MLGLVFAVAHLAPRAQAQAPEDSPWRVDYIARLGWGNGIIPFTGSAAVDAEGNQYVAGTVQIRDLPTTDGVVQPQHAGGNCGTISQCRDAFVAKLDSEGQLVWLTYLGGTAEDSVSSVAVDQQGNVYLAGAFFFLPGQIFPADFPFTSLELPPAESPGGGFLVKLSPDAGTVLYAVPLPVGATAMAIGESGAVYLTGRGDVSTLNTQPSLPRGGDNNEVWIGKVSPAADRLEYSLVVGGGDEDRAVGIAVDSDGQAYVCGETRSNDFPVTPGAFQADYHGGDQLGGDAFALKINAAGTALVYSTYLGGSDFDEGLACSLGPDVNLFVAGWTGSENFPTTPDAFQPQFQSGDQPPTEDAHAFVAKLDPSGGALLYSTFLGGTSMDAAYAIAVDNDGKAYIGGLTGSLDFPVRQAAQSSNRGFADGFVTLLNEAGSAVVFATYLGGHAGDDVSSIAVSPAGEIFASGYAFADIGAYLPGTAGAFHWDGAGYWAAKFSPEPSERPLVYLDGIVNAASFRNETPRLFSGEDTRGAVSPGELVTLFGHGIGPESPLGVAFDANGRISTNTGGTRVLFDGIPAALIYASANQVNAVVPWSVEGKLSVQVEVEYNGRRSAIIELPVIDATPALFTSTPWGMGQAAAFNQDGTLNSRDNPAALGSIIVLYATGLGPLDRIAEDGEIIPSEPPYAGLRLPLTVLIGYLEAEVLYAGPAPGYVAGLMQINARIPSGLYNTDGATVSLRVGEFATIDVADVGIQFTANGSQ